MIGVFDYTVILTYLSVVSAVCGCIVSISGHGHPYIGGFFLLFCGLCDTFDGIVARSKKDRSPRETAFGVQIDSLSDLLAFGILPAMIAVGLLTSEGVRIIPFPQDRLVDVYMLGFVVIVILYVLAALIRLAFFNVLDEEKRYGLAPAGPKCFVGLPVTSSALIFPIALLMNYFIPRNLSLLYVIMLVITGGLFLGRFRIKKPSRRMLTILLIAGGVEFFLLLILLIWFRR